MKAVEARIALRFALLDGLLEQKAVSICPVHACFLKKLFPATLVNR